jgi:hypothetical protein
MRRSSHDALRARTPRRGRARPGHRARPPQPDDLIESFPVYLVSDPLATRLTAFAGLRFQEVTVRPGGIYLDAHGDVPHKQYVRLLPDGEDAWVGDDLLLCVSDRLMAVLGEFDLRRCDVTEAA